MKLSTYTIGALLFTATAAILNAQSSTVINFGPSEAYVTSDLDFDRMASTNLEDTAAQITEFSMETPILKNSATYTGPSIYGGYQFSSTNGAWSFATQKISNRKGVSDSIKLQCYSQESWAGEELSLHGVFLFKNNDVTEGKPSIQMTINGLSVTWSTYFKGTERNVEGRYVVEIDNNYYVSKSPISMTNSGSNYLTAAMLSTTQWAPYHPDQDLNFNEDSAVYSTLSLNNVTAAGIYFEEDRWIGDDSVSSPYGFSITAFKATGSHE
jgi:hypothetical protein